VRKLDDKRFYIACEAGAYILWSTFGVPSDQIETDDRFVRYHRVGADVHSKDKRYGVVVGILREDTLLKLLEEYEAIIHLPFPKMARVRQHGDTPTHFRAFFRSKAWEKGKEPVIWGQTLTHARSEVDDDHISNG